MRPLRAFSDPARTLIFVLLALTLAGCAGRLPKMQEPVEPRNTDAALPGSERKLPSTENRGLAPRDAPVVFGAPSTGSSTGTNPGTNSSHRRSNGYDDGFAGEGIPGRTDQSREDGSSGRDSQSNDGVSPNPTPAANSGGDAPETRTVRPASPRPTPMPEVRLQAGDAYFSVQLLVSSTAETAAEWQAEAIRRLGSSVRIDHEHGLYKIRMGMAAREDAAEEIRRQAIVKGYEDAFLVQLKASGSQAR